MPQQKPEWKRYKQYTRNDINAAIECVRNGMSALQAARQFKVPSRTLYDKVKKLGITQGRPMNRTIRRSPSNNGGPAAFPYGISGTRSTFAHSMDEVSHGQSYNDSENGSDAERERERGERKVPHHLPPAIPHPAAALLEATFLQQAFDARGGEIAGRDALNAMALAAAAHASLNGMSTSPGTHGTARSPSPTAALGHNRSAASPKLVEPIEQEEQTASRSPFTASIAAREQSSSPEGNRTLEDQVEDLSISKIDKEKALSSASTSPAPMVPQQLGVIVPPITKKLSKSNEDLSLVKLEIPTDDK